MTNENKLAEKEERGALSEQEYKTLMELRAEHERALKRKRREQRIARVRRSEELVKKHRVSSKWFEHLVEDNMFVKVKTDKYGRVQRG